MGIQEAFTGAAGAIAGAALVGEKLSENERQANEKASKEAKATQEAKAKEEQGKQRKLASDTLEAKMLARQLGLETKGFGMLRKKGKFIGSYSSVAEKLSKDAITDSLSSRAINEEGFTQRILALGGTRKGRVSALIKASGGKK